MNFQNSFTGIFRNLSIDSINIVYHLKSIITALYKFTYLLTYLLHYTL